MRDIPLLIGFFGMCLWALRYPHIGILLWCWTALIVPNYYVYGLGSPIQFNRISAILTILALLLSGTISKLTFRSTMGLLLLLGLWGTISALTGISSEHVWDVWEQFIKIILFALVVAATITTKERIIALLFAIYLSLGFHGLLSGAKVIASGGAHHVYGPGTSIISDNNHFALAMIALLPIILYLYKYNDNRLIKIALAGSAVLITFSILGTYSRGGLVGISALAVLAFIRSKRRIRYLIVTLPLAVAAISFAPDRWFDRMETIQTADQDASFMGRVIAWKQSTLIAMDHPIFGGGFFAVQEFSIWKEYSRHFGRLDIIPTDPPDTLRPHAAHSIYFEVLGDLGFVGLAIFISILISSWRNAAEVIKLSRDRSDLKWASDLALAGQYALFAYMISGAALNMAYFDYIYIIFALLFVLRRLIEQNVAHESNPRP